MDPQQSTATYLFTQGVLGVLVFGYLSVPLSYIGKFYFEDFSDKHNYYHWLSIVFLLLCLFCSGVFIYRLI